MFCGCPSVRACVSEPVRLSVSLGAQYFINCLVELHQIYHVGGDKGELSRFWGQKVKGHGRNMRALKMQGMKMQRISR